MQTINTYFLKNLTICTKQCLYVSCISTIITIKSFEIGARAKVKW